MVTIAQNLTKMRNISTMPPEILIRILSYLTWYQLVSVQRVSRVFKELVRGSVELRYIIELGADALVHNELHDGSAPLTIQDCLNLLLDRRRRWRTLDWTKQVMVPLPGSCQAYELVGGVFAKSMRGGFEDMWPPSSRHFIAASLPTRDDPNNDDVEPSLVKDNVKEDLGIWTRDFAIDPTQDLLALLEVDPSGVIKVHIRTLSSQEIHPLATQSPLIAQPPRSDNAQELQISNCFLQIVGDVVGMFYWQSGHCLRIWNWHTGVMMTRQNEGDLPQGCWDLTFLSPRAYMIACAGETGSLELYAVNETPPIDGVVPPPLPILRLRLPELQPHRHLRTITTHSAPYLAHPEALRSPFVQHQDRRVHLIQLLYGDLLPGYALYVKNEYLLDLMTQMHERRGAYHDLQLSTVGKYLVAQFEAAHALELPVLSRMSCLPWEKWGPRETRFLQQDLRFQWLRYVNGYRVVMPPSASGAHSVQEVQRHIELCVYDFNVHPKRIDDPSWKMSTKDREQDGQEWTYEINVGETEIRNDDLFRKPVKSSLSYSVAKLTGVSGYTGFMIDEQRLVGMKENMSLGLAACDVDVFTL